MLSDEQKQERNAAYKEARKLKEEKRYDDAIAKFEEVLRLDDKYVYALHACTQCYTETGRHAEAIAMAKKAVELEPDDYMAYVGLSRAYQRGGMIPEAEMAMMQGQQAQMRAQTRR